MTDELGLAHFLFGLVGMLLGSLGTIAAMSNYFVTRSYYDAHTKHCQHLAVVQSETEREWKAAMTTQLANMNRKNDVQFRMLRSLIAHSDHLTPEQRERIRNEGRDQ